jgi:hypothetical protein
MRTAAIIRLTQQDSDLPTAAVQLGSAISPSPVFTGRTHITAAE